MSMYNLASLADFLEHARRRYEGHLVPVAPPAPAGFATDPSYEAGIAEASATPNPLAQASWQALERICQGGEVTTGIVTGWNRGGLLVRWNDLQGFVPASQLKDVPLFESEDSRDEKLSQWVGEVLNLKIIELDPGRNRLVFSERATIWGPKDGEQLMADLAPNDVREGLVSNLCDFGAFVDLGGIDGLIHISELSWGRVIHPTRHLHIGQRVRVLVLTVDRAGRHVGLSLKRLQPNPWSLVDERYKLNQVVQATVTNVVEFGAFAQLEEGLEGLIHVSEMADGRVTDPRTLVAPGARVWVRILRIDAPKHRLSLSMRAPAEPNAGLPDQR